MAHHAGIALPIPVFRCKGKNERLRWAGEYQRIVTCNKVVACCLLHTAVLRNIYDREPGAGYKSLSKEENGYRYISDTLFLIQLSLASRVRARDIYYN